MLWTTTRPGSALESNGSMVCMIGGAGKLPAKMARTKKSPAIEAMTSGGVTPYLTWGDARSCMTVSSWLFNYDRHTICQVIAPARQDELGSECNRSGECARDDSLREQSRDCGGDWIVACLDA